MNKLNEYINLWYQINFTENKDDTDETIGVLQAEADKVFNELMQNHSKLIDTLSFHLTTKTHKWIEDNIFNQPKLGE